MTATYNLSANACLFHADARDVLRVLPANSVDSGVMDPPYALVSVVKRFGSPTAAPAHGNDAYMRASAGFMGKTWDTGECAMDPTFWAEVLRVLKPGAFLVAFGASRGYHRMACAIEDAGFEVRDSLMWLYGTGFPKSHDVSKGVDRHFGAEREVVGQMKRTGKEHGTYGAMAGDNLITRPATPQAAEWEGWGTAIKPAFEPIVLARKPLSEGTVAANVLRWRCGALNIDASRIHSGESTARAYTAKRTAPGATQARTGETKLEDVEFEGSSKEGRWPANVVTDGSDEVVGAFPSTKPSKPGSGGVQHSGRHGGFADIGPNPSIRPPIRGHSDSGGSAARFFYSAKASKADRAGSKHPTVKPIALMEWLCQLVTPPGGTVLDPFAGSGTTGIAAQNKGFNVILCEREAEYVADIRARFGVARVPSPGLEVV